MNIDEAIKISTRWHEGIYPKSFDNVTTASKLGVEALKVLKHGRLIGAHHDPYLLPGETED